MPSAPRMDDDRSAEALQVAHRAADIASDKLAADIVVLDIRAVSVIADYFVICSAGTDRQGTAIVNDLDDKLRQELGRAPLHREGVVRSGWVLLDYGDVVIHVFTPEYRAFYALEQLWSEATEVLRLQ